MANIQIFTSPEFGDIRTVDQNGEPWFVGKDVPAAITARRVPADVTARRVPLGLIAEQKQMEKTMSQSQTARTVRHGAFWAAILC